MAEPATVTGHLFNRITGEVSVEQYEIVPDDRRHGRRRNHDHDRSTGNATRYTTPYLLLFRPALPILLTLGGTELRAFLAIASQIDHKHETIRPDLPAAAKSLGITVPTLRNAITALVKAGLLTRPSRGRIGFHPGAAWCGGAGRREQLIHHQKQETCP